MKQTNNAIKFLMAQYRAIFKNANIAMFAAIAAAALAAGQAQAATGSWDKLAAGDKVSSNTTISGSGDVTNSGGFDLTVTSGTLTFEGSGSDATFKLADGKKGAITIDGKDAKVAIGSQGKSGAAVKVTSFSVNNGNATIGGQDKSNSLTAGAITIGTAPVATPPAEGGAKAAAAATAKVTIGKSGSLAASGDGSTLTIYSNGELAFSKDATEASSTVTASTLNLNGGKISVENSGSAAISGSIAADAGTIDIGGKDQNTGLKVTGNVTFNNGGALTIAKSGTLTVADSANDVTLDLGTATVSNAGKVVLNVVDAKTATVKVSAEQYAELFKGVVSGSGGGDKTKLVLDIVGDSEVDLATVLESGSANAKKLTVESGSITINADKAKYVAHNELKQSGKFGTLTAGSGSALTISGATVEIGKQLSIDGGVTSGTLTLSGSGKLELNGTGIENDVQAKSITLNGDKAALNVKGGTWSVNTLTLTSGTATVDNGSALSINGDLTTTGGSGSIVVQNASTLDASAATKLTLKSGSGTKHTVDIKGGSTLELKADQVFTFDKDTAKLTSGDSSVEANSIQVSADSVLNFVVADGFKINEKQLSSLIETLGGKTDNQLKGFISFKDSKDNGIKLDGVSGDSIALDKVTNADVYDGMTATTADGNVNKNVMIGNINVTTDSGSVTLASGTTAVLYNADANGNFVSNKKGTTDVSIADKANLTLAGVGKAGAIDGAAKNQGNVTFGHSRTGETAGEVTVTSIGAKNGVESVNVFKGGVIVTAKPEKPEESVKIQTKNLNLADGTFLKAADQDIVVASATADKSAQIFGDLEAKSLTLQTSGSQATTFNIAKGAFVDVGALTLQESGSLFVGENDGTTTSSATLEVGKLTLAKGSLIVDPAMTEPASIAAVKEFGQTDKNGDAIVDGKIAVGQNSAVGIGFNSRAEVEQVLTQAGLMADHKFIDAADSLKGALILNNAINVASGNGVLIDTSAKTAKDLSTAVSGDKFQMKGNAALIVNDSVYKRVNGKLEGVAVTLANGNNGSVLADATSKVILNGDFDANDAGVQIFAGSGSTVNAVSGTIAFVSANGVLSGTISSGGQIGNITVDKTKLDNSFLTVSAPVRDLLKTAIINQGGVIDKGQIGGKFLSQVANNIADPSGVAADAAAHAATYAGAQQAAVVSVTTMADAMFGRVGAVGVEAASIAATGSQANGGVWLTPMYKSMDADGFNAEGASYGSDVDAAGVAFGADTVNGNMRFGAVFNIGSGDAEGKGNGNGLKDEFDYYGFGIYSAMGFGNFALVGDASMTVVSHDVEGFGLRGKADTTAVTMGITGQYSIATPVVDVTPHLGARFIRLNTDSYDLISADGLLATTDFDVQNVFSVPLGVTLSKAFVAGGWTLAPSADLTVTFNSGDTEAKSTTTFTGAPAIGLNTEVLDEVTYGLTVGLGAQYGAFGTSFGINYTGSENTDSFGVNAQCRYMF